MNIIKLQWFYQPFLSIISEIVRRYNIMSVPTLMFFQRGEVLWRESGRVDYEHLVNVLDELEKHDYVLP